MKARTDAEKLVEKITLQREYEAVTKQIDEARVVENALLKARNASNKLVDELDGQLKAQEEVCDVLKAEVEEEKSKIDGILKEKNEKIVDLDARCIQIKAEGISDDIYAKFCRIVKDREEQERSWNHSDHPGAGLFRLSHDPADAVRQRCQARHQCHRILPILFQDPVLPGG